MGIRGGPSANQPHLGVEHCHASMVSIDALNSTALVSPGHSVPMSPVELAFLEAPYHMLLQAPVASHSCRGQERAQAASRRREPFARSAVLSTASSCSYKLERCAGGVFEEGGANYR